MTDLEFRRLARGQCLYVSGIPVPFLVVEAGSARGNLWVLCPQDDFHVLATRGLSETREGSTVTWRDAAGNPALVITPLAGCEELSPGDAANDIEAARAYYAKGEPAEWLAGQIAGAGEASEAQTTWQSPQNF